MNVLGKASEWVRPLANLDDFDGVIGSATQLTAQNFSIGANYNVTLYYSENEILKNITLATGIVDSKGEIATNLIIPTLPEGSYLIEITDSTNKTDYVEYKVVTTSTATTPIPGFTLPFMFLASLIAISFYWYRKKRIV
ncbi:MAG: hypothetical protein ACTSVE_03585 [Candidatus Helarchaeota archaeon]